MSQFQKCSYIIATKERSLRMSPVTVIIAVLVIWNAIISFFVFRMVTHYNRLTEGISTHTLRESLEKILDAYIKNKRDVDTLSQAITKLKVEGSEHFQRIGIVRFNPFSDTGGSQSFTMALLDEGNNGLVMTSLYARTGNRWYIKNVRGGAGVDVELSREEKSAVKQAGSVRGK